LKLNYRNEIYLKVSKSNQKENKQHSNKRSNPEVFFFSVLEFELRAWAC
jgi:hypothetical protein